ncbi:MBL fold metallo-hydrolase [Pseudosulfitobacter sp. SM2401]|uniref:MBL fold metallo-hydrolase n=1 Tax=Pseudosulfitobacter sp. SM2401 TaxID=3350098 RepID=UPI0036F3CB55
MMHLYVEHEFKPVGQGLFAYGSLTMLHTPKGKRRITFAGQAPEWEFQWVYDCGSSSGQTLVNRGIQDIASKLNGKSLDLIVISHLHFDHISGLLELLKKVHVKSIMLPWAPLWQRLLIGFEQGLRDGDVELEFYADPTGYIASVASDRFERIFFVLPSDGGDRTDPDEPFPSLDPDGPDLDRREGIKAAPTRLPDKLQVPDTSENRHFTEVFKSGARLVKGGAWEFVPYNDPKSAPKSPETFKKTVNELRPILLGHDDVAREKALKQLKRLYSRGFPAGSQNDLSLSIYTGPVPLSRWTFDSGKIVGANATSIPDAPAPILYTGDGNFSTKTHWLRLATFLGNKRTKAISTFQVPHHGSRYNWKNGNARLVSPTFSVFSSDPTRRYGHPHAEVLRDFLLFGSKQVDKHNDFKWDTHFSLPKE